MIIKNKLIIKNTTIWICGIHDIERASKIGLWAHLCPLCSHLPLVPLIPTCLPPLAHLLWLTYAPHSHSPPVPLIPTCLPPLAHLLWLTYAPHSHSPPVPLIPTCLPPLAHLCPSFPLAHSFGSPMPLAPTHLLSPSFPTLLSLLSLIFCPLSKQPTGFYRV